LDTRGGPRWTSVMYACTLYEWGQCSFNGISSKLRAESCYVCTERKGRVQTADIRQKPGQDPGLNP